MKLEEYLDEIVLFLKKYLKKSHAKGYTLGLSGGIDSALVLALLLKATNKENIHVVIMPLNSDPKDAKDAIELCHKFDIKYDLIDLTPSFLKYVEDVEKIHKLDELSLSNIKVRLRMVTLYAIAQKEHSLVVGTDNLDERYVGYFTKFGDGACDLMPIAKLTKGEVYKASKMLGVSETILSRPPSAGLFLNQKDEVDLGVSYPIIDKYLLGEQIDAESKKRIKYLHKISAHKRNKIVEPKAFKRE